MTTATCELEEAARRSQRHQDRDPNYDEMQLDVSETWVGRYFLLPGTIVDFSTAAGDSYDSQLNTIQRSVGGRVYLSFMDMDHKERIIRHAEMTGTIRMPQ
jgi:hypothetical protein